MSRGFRNADVTLELSSQAAAETVERIRREDEAQTLHAAERRARGEHGRCEDCGRAIEPARLEFLPDATRCIDCQGRHERGR